MFISRSPPRRVPPEVPQVGGAWAGGGWHLLPAAVYMTGQGHWEASVLYSS